MLNLKKVIALVCVFAMMLTTVAFGATYSDVAEDSAYYEAVETLNKLGIVNGYEDGTFKPEDGVTRAEMAKLIACIQGYGETAKGSANTGFADVPASHWASGYVANAAGMGIINGYGDGNFGPEDPVKYEQAVKMVMATLGYTPFAEKNGGYPTGYLAAAQRYDVSLAVANAAVGQDANRGTVAQILANALDTPLMIQSKWSTDGTVDYVIADGTTVGGVTYGYKTLMSENLGYVKLRGVVKDTYTTSLAAGKTINTIDDDDVSFNNLYDYGSENSVYLKDTPTNFLVGDTDIADYLGQSVICYVKKVDNDWVVISVAVDTARNEELVIALDQFAGDAVSGSSRVLSYYRDGANDTTDVALENSISVVFNGVGLGDQDIDNYVGTKLAGGQIRLIDNDTTAGFDVAIIDYASTAVVEEANEDGIIFLNDVKLEDGNEIVELPIDADDTTAIVKIYKDGEEIDYTTLNKYDVLSLYAYDTNLKLVRADVVANQIVGTISSTKKSLTSSFPAAPNSLAYKVADDWYDVAEGAYGTTDLDIREGGTFYIDEFGKIAAFIEDAALAGATSVNYAYVFGVATEKADFGAAGAIAKLQLLTANGLEVVELKSNAEIEAYTEIANPVSGTTKTAHTVALDLTKWTYSGDTYSNDGDATYDQKAEIEALQNTVVQYIANANGVVTQITSAGFDGDFKSKGGASNAEYSADRNRLDTIGYLEDDAIVFVIGTKDTSFVGTVADLEDEAKYNPTASYQDKKSTGANVVVIPYSDVKTSKTSGVAVIVEAGKAYNDDDEAIWNLTFLLDGETITANTVSDTTALGGSSIPAAGDVVKVKIGSNGVITSLERVWTGLLRTSKTDNDITAYATYASTANGISGGLEKFYGGQVTAWDKDYKTGSIYDGSATKTDVQITRAKNIYVVDGTGRSVVIKNAAAGSYKYFAKLYDTNAETVTFIDGTTSPGTDQISLADQIYVREYDGDITDVIIVKGFIDKVN